MGGLIPLRLNTIQESEKLSSTSFLSPPPIPQKSAHRRPLLTGLTILPYTNSEWYQVMEEVKSLYSKCQYKQCSTRCLEIIEGIKDPYRVHPLYQIYLSFFAATSLELVSGAQHPTSPTKLPLLQQSLIHYQKAFQLIEPASFSADPSLQAMRIKRKSSMDSTSSARSSTSSVFSATSSYTSSSAVSSAEVSPITDTTPKTQQMKSYSLFPQPERVPSPVHKRAISAPVKTMAPRPLKPKKNVTFSLQLQLPVRVFTEDELELVSPSTLIASFPCPPPSASTSPEPTLANTMRLRANTQTSTASTRRESKEISTFLLTRSLARYSANLSTLQQQLSYHIHSVESQITHQKSQVSSLRSPKASATHPEFEGPLGPYNDDEETSYRSSLRTRIARLKAAGWKRKRFDGSRYRELCEKAMGELE